jgi:hypothetical protein
MKELIEMYYKYCMEGGINTADEDTNAIVLELMKIESLKLDYSLYSPTYKIPEITKEVSKDAKKIIETIKSHKDYKETANIKREKITPELFSYYLKTQSLRSNKPILLKGNLEKEQGLTPDYIITDYDKAFIKQMIEYLKIKNIKDIKKYINIYLQTPQNHHPNTIIVFTRKALLNYIADVCIPEVNSKKKCVKKDKLKSTSNITSSLLYTGRAEEHSILFILMYNELQQQEFDKLIKDPVKNKKKIEEILKNEVRLTGLTLYKKDNKIDQGFTYKNNKYLYMGGHTCCSMINKGKIELIDTYFRNMLKKKSSMYKPHYLLDTEKFKLTPFENNILIEDKDFLALVKRATQIEETKEPKKEPVYLNENVKINEYFLNPDVFVQYKEQYFHEIREKVFKRSYPTIPFDASVKEGKKVNFFLEKDIV